MIEVSELQRDALGEIFNIGVGRAASSLSQIVQDEIELSAPDVRFVAPDNLGDIVGAGNFERFSLVSQEFSGPFDANAMLLFPEENALLIVGKMLGGLVPPEQLGEFEQEAMCEVGNIILNACISVLADLFQVEFSGSLPSYEHAERAALNLTSKMREHVPVILLIRINLVIRQHSVQGHLLFLMGVSSLDDLLKHLDTYLQQLGLE